MNILKNISTKHKGMICLVPMLALSGCSTFPTPFGFGELPSGKFGYKPDITLDIIKHAR